MKAINPTSWTVCGECSISLLKSQMNLPVLAFAAPSLLDVSTCPSMRGLLFQWTYTTY